MARFDTLIETVDEYQVLAAENYDRIRNLAEGLRRGLCDHLGATDGECVRLVPPAGPFEPKNYGANAFSVAPKGFRPLGPIAFGLAVRVTRGTDWIRLTIECRKAGDAFTAEIVGGPSHELGLPLEDHDAAAFYDEIFDHIQGWFADRIARYREGDYGTREIGFDFSAPERGGED